MSDYHYDNDWTHDDELAFQALAANLDTQGSIADLANEIRSDRQARASAEANAQLRAHVDQLEAEQQQTLDQRVAGQLEGMMAHHGVLEHERAGVGAHVLAQLQATGTFDLAQAVEAHRVDVEDQAFQATHEALESLERAAGRTLTSTERGKIAGEAWRMFETHGTPLSTGVELAADSVAPYDSTDPNQRRAYVVQRMADDKAARALHEPEPQPETPDFQTGEERRQWIVDQQRQAMAARAANNEGDANA